MSFEEQIKCKLCTRAIMQNTSARREHYKMLLWSCSRTAHSFDEGESGCTCFIFHEIRNVKLIFDISNQTFCEIHLPEVLIIFQENNPFQL